MARTAARRYAEAIVSLAKESSSFDAWDEALGRLALAFENPRAKSFLLNPSVPVTEKRKTMNEIVGTDFPAANNLVQVLLEHRRVKEIPGIYEHFTEAWLNEQGVAIAYVTTAEPVSPEDERTIRTQLAKLTGKQIELRLLIDPDIIGGIVARVGDSLFDGSVRTKLRALRLRLAAVSG